jgi:hypothetical protein
MLLVVAVAQMRFLLRVPVLLDDSMVLHAELSYSCRDQGIASQYPVYFPYFSFRNKHVVFCFPVTPTCTGSGRCEYSGSLQCDIFSVTELLVRGHAGLDCCAQVLACRGASLMHSIVG